MTKFPLIESLGLPILNDEPYAIPVVVAMDLEKALRDAPIFYGTHTSCKLWDADFTDRDSHTARLVCIQPIKKKTKGDAAIEMLNDIWLRKDWSAEDIQKILEMKE